MQRRRLVPLCSSFLCACSLFLPAAVRAAQPAAAESVQLAYRFRTGQSARQQVTSRNDLVLTLRNAQGKKGETVPLTTEMTAVLTRQVTEVSPQGAGTVWMHPNSARLTMRAGSKTLVVSFNGGRVTATSNGEPVSVEQAAPGAAASLAEAVGIQQSPNGQVLVPAGSGETAVTAGASPVALRGVGLSLPSRPVIVGESWEEQASMPLLLPGAPGTGPLQMRLAATSTLKSITDQAGQRIAAIETRGAAFLVGAPGRPPVRLSDNIRINTDINITSGEMVRSKFSMDLDAAVEIAFDVPQADRKLTDYTLLLKGKVESETVQSASVLVASAPPAVEPSGVRPPVRPAAVSPPPAEANPALPAWATPRVVRQFQKHRAAIVAARANYAGLQGKGKEDVVLELSLTTSIPEDVVREILGLLEPMFNQVDAALKSR